MTKSKLTLRINQVEHQVEVEGDTPLLWGLRETLGLTGSKYSCGIGVCGACTVHIDGEPMRSCVVPVQNATGTEITTIEGIGNEQLHPLQEALIAAQAPQCGYCYTGQVMQALPLLDRDPPPSRQEIRSHMNGAICRCGSYYRIMKAIESSIDKNS